MFFVKWSNIPRDDRLGLGIYLFEISVWYYTKKQRHTDSASQMGWFDQPTTRYYNPDGKNIKIKTSLEHIFILYRKYTHVHGHKGFYLTPLM